MKVQARGFWGIVHFVLNWIGKGVLAPFPAKTLPRDEEAYTMAGGATLGVIFGALFGFLSFAQPPLSRPAAGAIIGGLLGWCAGIVLGAVVEVVDEYIDSWLYSVDSADELDRARRNFVPPALYHRH